jgi:ABC-type uncharacterized transport system permease subunit
MSRRARMGFAAACLLLFGLIAALVMRATPSGRTPAAVTLGSEAARPAGLTVVDLRHADQLQARFTADQGAPRLVLALAPT